MKRIKVNFGVHEENFVWKTGLLIYVDALRLLKQS